MTSTTTNLADDQPHGLRHRRNAVLETGGDQVVLELEVWAIKIS